MEPRLQNAQCAGPCGMNRESYHLFNSSLALSRTQDHMQNGNPEVLQPGSNVCSPFTPKGDVCRSNNSAQAKSSLRLVISLAGVSHGGRALRYDWHLPRYSVSFSLRVSQRLVSVFALLNQLSDPLLGWNHKLQTHQLLSRLADIDLFLGLDLGSICFLSLSCIR